MTGTDMDHQREVELNEGMVEASLCRLAANLMRISRGSGTLYEVEAQVMELAELFAKHRGLTSHGVSPHIFDKALSYDPDISPDDKELADFQRVRSQIVKGSLQLAASELIDNKTTEHQGQQELLEGQLKWEELRKKRTAKSQF
ncbi:hypothetical protein [Phaeobacter italicus]|uniref:hypothetical protein n=1 Tax=Phaeobacter italicus TaxID=481446 RepID=UPI001C973158|nr:hypothetical protein [Phaeobacter italicus]MBY6045286.1 hypothetical protein [Phaeobacter italicus]